MNTLMETAVRLFASPECWVEAEAVRQLYAIAKLDGVRQVVGFPDLQPAKGGPAGAAFVAQGVIYPHLIGGDIGCGMELWKTSLEHRKATPNRWADLRFDLEHPWEGNLGGWLQDHQLPSTEFDEAMGTIGGGNHFAELQAVEEILNASAFRKLGLRHDELLVLVHSGSRGCGESVPWNFAIEHGTTGVAPSSQAGAAYLRSHGKALRWARANRELIVLRFLDMIGGEAELVWDGCHNSITPMTVGDARLWLHRRGAAPSDAGPLVIAGSRGAFSYLVQPTGGGEASAWSLAHGAGRKWSRSESRLRVRERHRVSELAQTPLGSRVICEPRDLLYEEAPMAYKPIESVIRTLVKAGLAKVIATLRPVLTYKTRAVRR